MIQRTLDCGATLLAEPLPAARSVTAGIWTAAGSIIETPEQNGISHFIEHMLFKGTKNRTAKQIAVDVDNIGAQMNAFTSKEATCYYIKMMDEKLEEGLDILTDLFCNATLPEDELEKERGVVLEEIAMSNDTPEDVASDLIAATFFKGTSLAKTILGPPENIKRFTRADLLSYMQRYYTADNVLVAVCGKFDVEDLCGILNSKMERMNDRPVDIPAFARINDFPYTPGFAVTPKDIEQVHVYMGMPCCSMQDRKKRYATNVLNNIIGGSMSSRLFQKIREEMGMAYSIYSHPVLYRDTGMFSVYAGTIAKNAGTVTEMILEELEKVRRDGVTMGELDQSRQMLKGHLILRMESTSARMMSAARGFLLAGEVLDEEQSLRSLEEVTADDVAQQIEAVTVPANISAAYVGTCDRPEDLRAALEWDAANA